MRESFPTENKKKPEKIWPKKETPALLRSAWPLASTAVHFWRNGVFPSSGLSLVWGGAAAPDAWESWGWDSAPSRRTQGSAGLLGGKARSTRDAVLRLCCLHLLVTASSKPLGCAEEWERRRWMCPDKGVLFWQCAACRFPDAQRPLPAPLLKGSFSAALDWLIATQRCLPLDPKL